MGILYGCDQIWPIGCVAAGPYNVGTIIGQARPTTQQGRSGLGDGDSGYLPASSNRASHRASGVVEEWKVVDVVCVEEVAAVKRPRTTTVREVVGIGGS